MSTVPHNPLFTLHSPPAPAALQSLNAKTQELSESSRRCVALAQEIQTISQATAEKLVNQGEVIDNLFNKGEGITEDLDDAKETLNVMEYGLFGRIGNFFGSVSQKVQGLFIYAEKPKKTLDIPAQPTGQPPFSHHPHAPFPQEGLVSNPQVNEALNECDRNLTLLSSHLDALIQQQTGVGSLLDHQNSQLDRFSQQVEGNSATLKNVTTRARRLT